jgi:hypothetical protein
MLHKNFEESLYCRAQKKIWRVVYSTLLKGNILTGSNRIRMQ